MSTNFLLHLPRSDFTAPHEPRMRFLICIRIPEGADGFVVASTVFRRRMRHLHRRRRRKRNELRSRGRLTDSRRHESRKRRDFVAVMRKRSYGSCSGTTGSSSCGMRMRWAMQVGDGRVGILKMKMIMIRVFRSGADVGVTRKCLVKGSHSGCNKRR